MTFDEFLGRVYFYPGIGLAIYGALVIEFNLPNPFPPNISTMLAGLVLMLIGTNVLRQARYSKVEIQGNVISAETTDNLTITNRKPEAKE